MKYFMPVRKPAKPRKKPSPFGRFKVRCRVTEWESFIGKAEPQEPLRNGVSPTWRQKKGLTRGQAGA